MSDPLEATDAAEQTEPEHESRRAKLGGFL